MPNEDRISEAYKGEIWDSELQRITRDRIHWMCAEARGRTLDLGCSQGIATILLAREGLAVVGVDHELDRLTYAIADLRREDPSVRLRAGFIGAEGSALPFADGSFETVLLGEILEHLVRPEVVLAEATRVLRRGGRLVVTTPWGYHPHHDHKRTFYAWSLVEMLRPFAGPVSLSVVDRYLRLIAIKGEDGCPEGLVLEVQEELEALALQSQCELNERRAETRELRRSHAETVKSLEEANKQAIKRLQSEAAALRRSKDRLQQRVDQLEARVSAERTKRQALESTRWWQLGRAGRRFVQEPWRIVRFVVEAWRALFGRRVPPAAPPLRARVTAAPAVTRPRGPVGTGRSRSGLVVASILDEFTHACFAPECSLVPVTPHDWQRALPDIRPDLLLVESAWRGNEGAWQYRVGSFDNPVGAGLRDLRALIEWCRANDIPTVFWNKEDPVHWDRFKEAAVLFDHIFTTDANCIDSYRSLPDLRARSVQALPFAAQPDLHNPIAEAGGRQTEPCFAGTYYRTRHPQRRKELEMLLDAAIPFGLIIYDRTSDRGSDSFGFPERFLPYVRPGLPYEEIVREYKRHRVFLNANSVQDSPTMFSRRVFEILACGTAVVSTPSRGMTEMFGDLVAVARTEQEATDALKRLIYDDDEWRRVTRAASTLVLREHTYTRRLATIAQTAGLTFDAAAQEQVAAIALVDSTEQGAAVVHAIASQSVPPAEVLLGGSVSDGLLETLRGRLDGDVVRIDQDRTSSVPERCRELAAEADSPWIWCVTPGVPDPLLLEELLSCVRFTRADVIGRPLRDIDEHSFSDSVDAARAIARRDLVLSHGWPAREEARDLMAEWFRRGVRMYSAYGGGPPR